MSSSSSSVRIGTTIRFGASGGPAGSAPGAAEPPLAEGDEDGDAEPDGVLGWRGAGRGRLRRGRRADLSDGRRGGRGVRPGQPEPDADRRADQHHAADDRQDQVAARAEGTAVAAGLWWVSARPAGTAATGTVRRDRRSVSLPGWPGGPGVDRGDPAADRAPGAVVPAGTDRSAVAAARWRPAADSRGRPNPVGPAGSGSMPQGGDVVEDQVLRHRLLRRRDCGTTTDPSDRGVAGRARIAVVAKMIMHQR